MKVVSAVVDRLEVERRPKLVALGGVVVDHIEDHLDARLVQRLHGLLELDHRILHGITTGGREPGQCVVAPVVGEAAFVQETFARESVHRHELDRGHTQRLQMIEDGRHREREVFAAPFRRHVRMLLCKTLDVQFVDEGVAPGYRGLFVVFPVELAIDHATSRHEWRAVDKTRPQALGVCRIVTHDATDATSHRRRCRAPTDRPAACWR